MYKRQPPASDELLGTTFARSLVLGGRLLLLSDAGVLSTSVAAPGPGDFVRYPG